MSESLVTARKYAQNAASYGQAAQSLIVEDDLRDSLNPAFYLLVGFSLELGLKSLCLSSGALLKVVKSWRHDLTKALQGAISYGHAPIYYTDLHRLVETIGPLHKDLVFRYPPATMTVIPVPPPQKCIEPLLPLAQRASREAWKGTPQLGNSN